jgi:hypothetical protein
MVDHAALSLELRAELLAEEEVRRVVPVQVADLLTADREREFTAAPGPSVHVRPRGDLVGYALAWRRHGEEIVAAGEAGSQW